jgi:hypothetical protein
MLNVTWVIDFGRRASPVAAVRVVGETNRTLRMVESRRRRSREMFAVTRVLLAEARAVLATSPALRAGAGPLGRRVHRASAGHAVAGWNPTHD